VAGQTPAGSPGWDLGRLAQHPLVRRVVGRVRRPSDVAFVETAYRGLLDRQPDPTGLSHHVGALAEGLTRPQLLTDLAASAEAARHQVYAPGVRLLVEEFWRSRQAAGPSVRPLFFLHIMKTAGTALTYALEQMALDWPRLTDLLVDHLVCLPPPLLADALLIAGHLPYEALSLLPSGGAVCTVLRDPVARTLSHHAHVNETRGLPLVSLQEFVTSETWRPLWVNYQARQLLHEVGLAGAWSRFSPVEEGSPVLSEADTRFPLQSRFDTGPLEGDQDTLLAAGLTRLDSIELVGITDAVPALLERIAELWDRPVPPAVPRLRVSRHRTEVDDVPAATLAEIRAGTVVDAQLYESARDKQ
jgi:hypothetical protein